MTAYASLDSAVEAIKKGAYDYITKPLDPVLLSNSIDKALASYGLIRSNRELIRRLEERVQRLDLVNQVGMAVTATLQFDDLIALARETLGQLFHCQVQLWLRQEQGRKLLLYGGQGSEIRAVVQLARQVMEDGIPLCLDRGFPAMVAPLVVGNRPIGVMGVSREPGQRAFDPEDFEIYKALVSFLAIATENARLTRDLRKSKEIVEEYSATLEAKVRERTLELEQRHSELQAAHSRLVQTTANLEQSNRQLRETRDRLISQEKMASLGVVAAGVAHEINNPIGFINSNLETLGDYFTGLNRYLQVSHDTLAVSAAEGDPGAQLAELRRALENLDLDFLLDDIPKLVGESRQGIARVSKIVLDLKVFSRQDNWEMVSADVNKALESALTIAWNQHEGEIYRFFTKPWDNEDMKSAIRSALQYLELIRENRRLHELVHRQEEELSLLRKGGRRVDPCQSRGPLQVPLPVLFELLLPGLAFMAEFAVECFFVAKWASPGV